MHTLKIACALWLTRCVQQDKKHTDKKKRDIAFLQV